MAPRRYSVEEANRVLPDVRRLVRRVVEGLRELPDARETARIKELRFKRDEAGDDEREELARAVADLRGLEMGIDNAIRGLQELDVKVKDLTIGLVDFESERDGEIVELCWRLGETEVANWHRIGEGYPGRKPL
jgi:hypothetical protein